MLKLILEPNVLEILLALFLDPKDSRVIKENQEPLAVEGHKEKVELRVLKDLQDLQAIVGI
jgi:hypothetical protein